MRIAQICHRYYPTMGGVQNCVKEISERLAKKSHKIEILTTDPSGELPKEENINGVRVLRYKSWAPNGAYYFPHPNMLSDLLSHQVDIVHAHNIHVLTTYMAYIHHILHEKTKFIISPYYHGRGNSKLAQIFWAPYKPLAKKIIRDADGIVVNSMAQRTLVAKTFKPLSNISMVYDGVNLNKIMNAEPFTIDESSKILLYVGRLEKYKGIHIAIASMKSLPNNYRFYIIGRGTFRPFLENLVQSLGLQSRVYFLGFQPNEAVYQWLKTAHVFIHLSSVESFGLTCIESLAAGTPVIANDDCYGLSETISLYPEHIRMYKASKEPISKLTRLIMEITELKPITEDVSRFSWDAIAENMETVYNQVLIDHKSY